MVFVDFLRFDAERGLKIISWVGTVNADVNVAVCGSDFAEGSLQVQPFRFVFYFGDIVFKQGDAVFHFGFLVAVYFADFNAVQTDNDNGEDDGCGSSIGVGQPFGD